MLLQETKHFLNFLQPKQQEQDRIIAAHGKSTIDHGEIMGGFEDEMMSSKVGAGRLSRRNSATSVYSHGSNDNVSVANSWIFNKTIDIGGEQVQIHQAAKNYYRNVAEMNKDVIKLVAHLQTAITSNKKVSLRTANLKNLYLWTAFKFEKNGENGCPKRFLKT